MEQESLGNDLRQQRIRQGYTVADVEAEIKIRSLYIEAIEEENFDQLPPRVYTIGFVRRYCTFLQIEDVEPIVQHYKNLFSQREAENPAVPEMQGIETAGRGNSPLGGKRLSKVRYDRILLTLLVILGITWAGIFTFSFISEKWANYQQKQAEQTALQQAEENTPPADPVPTVPEEETEPEAPVQENVVWDHLQVKLVIKENAQCWLSATADGAEIFNGMKNSTETLEFEAQNQFSLHLGNAGAVQLLVNGQDVTDDTWQNGQVLEIGYSLEQWQQMMNPDNHPLPEQP